MVNLFKIIPQKRKLLILSLGLVLLFALIPLHSAQAAWWNDLIAAVADIAGTILTLPFWIIAFPFVLILGIVIPVLSSFLFIISLTFLKWVAEGGFTTLQLTSGGIVDRGVAATTTLVNLGFILVLVFIALATILRLESYGLKKLLPKFIITVLLINFIPVICGAIIDIADIVTKSFLTNWDIMTFLTLFNPFQEEINKIQSIFQGNIAGLIDFVRGLVGLSGIIERVLKGALISFFGIFASFVFFLYFILFSLRYIIIWILVILAPIAWFCRILPLTQKYWKMWWNYFIQWAFIGAIAGFFLKLGSYLVSDVTGRFGTIAAPDVGGWQAVFTSFFSFFFDSINAVFLFSTVLIFLIIGFVLSLKLSSGGTDTVLKWGERGLKATGTFAKTQAATWATERVAASERVQRLTQRMATAQTPGTGMAGWRGTFVRGATAPIWAVGRAMGGRAGPGLIEQQRRIVDENEKRIAGQGVAAQLSAFRLATSDAVRLGILQAMAKDKNTDDALDATRFGARALTEAEIGRLFQPAERYDKMSILRSAFPEMARAHLPPGTPPGPPPPGITPSQHQAQYVFDRIRPADYENTSRRVLTDNEFLEALMRRGTGQHINRFVERFGIEGAQAVEQRIQALASAQGFPNTPQGRRQWLENINPRLARYFDRGAGAGLIQI